MEQLNKSVGLPKNKNNSLIYEKPVQLLQNRRGRIFLVRVITLAYLHENCRTIFNLWITDDGRS